MSDRAVEPASDEGPTRAQRALVFGALLLLLVGGLGEVEAWPLTGWRLFSAARGPAQSGWVMETHDGSGDTERLAFGELPVAYRMATWHLAAAARDPGGDGAAVCDRLLDAAREARPGTVGLRVYRDRQRLVRLPAGWGRSEVTEVALECGEGTG